MKHLFLLSALLLFGLSAGAFAAPSMARPVKAAAPISPGPFRDVPPGHWAAQSVETLRRAGIVRGYPPVRGQRAR